MARHVRESVLKTIIITLSDHFNTKEGSVRDLAALAIKSVVVEMPADCDLSPSIVAELLPRLLSILSQVNPHFIFIG